MSRSVRFLCLLLALLMGPAQADRAGPSQEIVIALEDRGGSLQMAGSTPRGAYRRAGGYGVGTAAERRLQQLADQHGLQPGAQWRIELLGWHCWRLRVADGVSAQAVLDALQREPGVALAQPLNHFEGQSLEPPAVSAYNDPYLPLQRPFHQLGAAQAQRVSRGAGVRIALIDSGVDAAHPDLQGRIAAQHDSVGAAHPAPASGERHGTQMAGLIVAVANNGQGIVGLAPEASLLALRACWEQGGKARCDSFTLARAMARAISERADVINLSLAGPRDPLLERLTQEALRRGILVVGSVPASGALDGFPAGVPGVLAVRSREEGGAAVLAAPGREVLTLLPGAAYDYASGSSLATAQLSGVLALLRARKPGLDAATAQAWLQGPGPLACLAMRQIEPQLVCQPDTP